MKKKDNREEVNKITIEKMKAEEDLRTAILEKNLLRDTERILLNTFDTLKMHYEAKKKHDEGEASKRTDDKKKDNGNNESRKEKVINCDKCDYKTDKEGNIRAHNSNVHDPVFENVYDRKKSVVHKCDKCDYKTPFVANLNIHMDEVHKKEERQDRRYEASKEYSYRERKDNGYCRNWNRSYSCTFERSCKFLHEDAPVCYFGDRCRRKTTCRYFHEELFRGQNESFLGQRIPQA